MDEMKPEAGGSVSIISGIGEDWEFHDDAHMIDDTKSWNMLNKSPTNHVSEEEKDEPGCCSSSRYRNIGGRKNMVLGRQFRI